MQYTFGRFVRFAWLVAIAWGTAWAQAAAPAPASSAPCGGKPLIEYTLGPKSEVDTLYPAIRSAAMSDYDNAMAVAASIQFYLQDSLSRDRIYDACALTIRPSGSDGYKVSFYSANPVATQYGATQKKWLENGKLALQGVQACQGAKDQSCWQPHGAGQSCAGPWQFYLPLGLPMVAQKMVMLLHYPPYTAMQQSDYLNNATLHRWQRLLGSVGVPANDWTLYTTTVDIFPVAAPGSGESGCFTTNNAVTYFGAPGSTYIPTMLQALVAPSASVKGSQTLPVIVFGGEATGYWNASYPDHPTGVLKAGKVALNTQTPELMTPFSGANHPIAAVYQSCESKPGIVTMVGQDLATACFAKTMGDTPNADPVAVQAACASAYLSATPAPAQARQICANALIDKSPQFFPWGAAQAKAWCAQHNNQVCPLPDYSKEPRSFKGR